MYMTDPMGIEAKSFEIIQAEMGEHSFSETELKVVMRTIHTTGDYDYKNIIVLHKDPIARAIKAVRPGCRIVTDTTMAFSGINKSALEKAGCSMDCFISHEEVYRIAKEKGITRSMASMDVAAAEGVDIFVIGNAPTALFRVGELIQQGKVSPQLVIGVPVGFVGAAESKKFIRQFEVPSITTRGTKGGSNVAASIINALLYMVVGR